MCALCGHWNRPDVADPRAFSSCDEHGPFCQACVLDLGYWNPRDACPQCFATTHDIGFGVDFWRPALEAEMREHLVYQPRLGPEWLAAGDKTVSTEISITVGFDGRVVRAAVVSGDAELGDAVLRGLDETQFQPFADATNSVRSMVTGRVRFVAARKPC